MSSPNGVGRDDIPPLTRGAYLIDHLVQTVVRSGQQPTSRILLERVAAVRKEFERYMTKIEKLAGVYGTMMKNAGSHTNSKGWSVCRATEGKKWRGSTHLGGRWRTVGTFRTRAEAQTACKEAVALIRAEAA